jgi:Cu+-exporting ATPase
LAASLERGSEHPLASAIISGAKDRNLSLLNVEQFEAIPGKGVRGFVAGQQVALGNERLFSNLSLSMDAFASTASDLRSRGETVMFLSTGNQIAGLIGVADPVKESTAEAIRLLRAGGLRIVMLTGDNRITANAVASILGIDEIEAEILPDGKAAVIKRLQAEGRFVAMAGDGVNDSPALAQAQVGIAMGTGTDVAIQSAGITLIKGDLRGIIKARRLSRTVMSNIRQNLFLAFIYNSIGIPVAAGILYPFFGLLLSPMIAAAAMSLSSVSVIANALRLRRIEI